MQADDPALAAARTLLGRPGVMFSAVVRADAPSIVALRYWIGGSPPPFFAPRNKIYFER